MRPASPTQRSTVSPSIEFVCRVLASLFVAAALSPYSSCAAAFPCSEATNVASAANGATATASSSYAGFSASGAINRDRKGLFVWQDG